MNHLRMGRACKSLALILPLLALLAGGCADPNSTEVTPGPGAIVEPVNPALPGPELEPDPMPSIDAPGFPIPGPDVALIDIQPFPLADDSQIDVVNFQLPDCEIINNIGRAVPCPMTGQIAVPNEPGPHPLVMLLHGVRAIEDVRTDDTYQGFDYLVRQLAAEGYVAVSFNIAVDFTFDYGESANYNWATQIYLEHLVRLAQANAGEDVGYGIELTGRVDLNQIHLIGHSRGAQIADMLARIDGGEEPYPGADQAFTPSGRIKSVITLGFVEAIGLDGVPADVPYGILVAEKDEDAHFNDGERLFELAATDPLRTASATMVVLADANHAYFNRMFPNRVPDVAVLDREQQEWFTTNFVVAFLDGLEHGDTSGQPLPPAPNIGYCRDPELQFGTIFDMRATLECTPGAAR